MEKISSVPLMEAKQHQLDSKEEKEEKKGEKEGEKEKAKEGEGGKDLLRHHNKQQGRSRGLCTNV